jgi:hypothetical protein
MTSDYEARKGLKAPCPRGRGIWVLAVSCLAMIMLAAPLAQGASRQYEDDLIQRAEAMSDRIHGLTAGIDERPIKCGTPLLYEIRMAWPQLSPQTQNRLAALALVDRPELDEVYDFVTTEGSHGFRIHYTRAGFDSVDLSEGLGEGGVPVYVLKCAAYFDTVVSKEVGELGFKFPISDAEGEPGEDPRFDIYFVNLGRSYYGLTTPLEPIDQPDGGVLFSSFMKLNCDYKQLGGYEHKPFEAMAVTAAHEFHHAIQWTYDGLEAEFRTIDDSLRVLPWFFELTSTYMEDVVFDYINDYYLYLWSFFDKPWYSLRLFIPSGIASTDAEQLHCYADAIFFHFLTEKYDDQTIVREIWEECGKVTGFNTFGAIETVLERRGSTFADAWAEFLVWNYFTGDRAADWSYEEGADFHFYDVYGREYSGKIPDSLIAIYEDYPLEAETAIYPDDPHKPDQRVPVPMNADDLGATYIEFIPGVGEAENFNVQVSSQKHQEWMVVTAGLKGNLKPDISYTQDIFDPITVENWSQYDEVLMIVSPFSQIQSQDSLPRNLGFSFEVQDSFATATQTSAVKKVYSNPLRLVSGSEDEYFQVDVALAEPTPVTMFIYTAGGELVRGGRQDDMYIGPGPRTAKLRWAGTNRDNERVASGVYLAMVRIGDKTEVIKVAVINR